jgi:hypothetical protein
MGRGKISHYVPLSYTGFQDQHWPLDVRVILLQPGGVTHRGSVLPENNFIIIIIFI